MAGRQRGNPSGKIILVEKQGVREVDRSELLLIGQITQSWKERRRPRSAVGIVDQTLEDGNGVQIGGISCAGACAQRRESQLAAGGTVGCIPQEIEPQQRMVIEEAVRSADHCLPVARGIPRHAHARLDVVGVGLNALLQSQEVVSSFR